MAGIRHYWDRVWQRVGWRFSLPRARVLQRRLGEVREQNQALRLELEAVQDAVEAGNDRLAQSLAEMQEKVEQLENERDTAAQQLETLQRVLKLALSRQERTERHITVLDDTLQQARASHRAEMQQAQDRLNRQARRSTGALLVAGLAMLFAAVITVTGMQDIREHTRILAGVSRDLRDIKSAMQDPLADTRPVPPAGEAAARDMGTSLSGPPQADHAVAGSDEQSATRSRAGEGRTANGLAGPGAELRRGISSLPPAARQDP